MDTTYRHRLSDREWILTNNLGGYSLGAANFINKRKYSGLLVASDEKFKRTHLVASIEEKVENEGTFFYLDSNHYTNCIYPNGYEHIVRSWLRPYPSILYSSNPYSEDFIIFKEVFMVKGKNTAILKYTNLGKKDLSLTLRPKLTMRNHHELNASGTWQHVNFERNITDNCLSFKRLDNGSFVHIYTTKGELISTDITYGSVYYPNEAIRGYDSTEDLFSPVRIDLRLISGEFAYVVFSSDSVDDPAMEAKEAEAFYKEFPLPTTHPLKTDVTELVENPENEVIEFSYDEYLKELHLAAQDFIVQDSKVVAGYPWFGPWSRDTLISMDSLKYLNEGDETAVKILHRYTSLIEEGLLPNTFGEGLSGLNYDSVDAPLWYIVQIYQYAKDDPALYEKGVEIILNYLNRVDLTFCTADDGLIEIRTGEHAVTWMDAKIYNQPVTPRFGKPVEINALWFNALSIISELSKARKLKTLRWGKYTISVKELDEFRGRVALSMQKYIGDNFLADRLENNAPVWEVRPNALMALSLPFDFTTEEVMKKVIVTAKNELLTQYGLRSLGRFDPAFKTKYIGNQKQRDLTYHQGTTWTFLLLPFVKVLKKVSEKYPLEFNFTKEATNCIWNLRMGFVRGEMGSVAEIWDGLDPYFSKGCPAQAWSVFALLGIEGMLQDGGNG